MKKLVAFIFSFVFFASIASVFAGEAQAAVCPAVAPTSSTAGQTFTISYDLSGESIKTMCTATNKTNCFDLRGCNTDMGGDDGCWANSNFALYEKNSIVVSNNKLIATVNPTVSLTYWLEEVDSNGVAVRRCNEQRVLVEATQYQAVCAPGTFKVVKRGTNDTKYTYKDDLEVIYNGNNTSGFHDQGAYAIFRENAQGDGSERLGDLFGMSLSGTGRITYAGLLETKFGLCFRGGYCKLAAGDYRLIVTDANIVGKEHYCIYNFEVSEDGANDQGGDDDEDSLEQVAFELCKQAGVAPGDTTHPCNQCFENKGIWTAVGCIPFNNATGMIQVFITLGLGIGGGVVVLMVLGGGFLLSTSQGDPKRVEEAKAMISSAVMGLLFVIFSITILRFIGVRVLQLPGFGS